MVHALSVEPLLQEIFNSSGDNGRKEQSRVHSWVDETAGETSGQATKPQQPLWQEEFHCTREAVDAFLQTYERASTAYQGQRAPPVIKRAEVNWFHTLARYLTTLLSQYDHGGIDDERSSGHDDDTGPSESKVGLRNRRLIGRHCMTECV